MTFPLWKGLIKQCCKSHSFIAFNLVRHIRFLHVWSIFLTTDEKISGVHTLRLLRFKHVPQSFTEYLRGFLIAFSYLKSILSLSMWYQLSIWLIYNGNKDLLPVDLQKKKGTSQTATMPPACSYVMALHEEQLLTRPHLLHLTVNNSYLNLHFTPW